MPRCMVCGEGRPGELQDAGGGSARGRLAGAIGGAAAVVREEGQRPAPAPGTASEHGARPRGWPGCAGPWGVIEVRWMGHTAPGALVLPECFALFLALQHCPSRAPRCRWLPSLPPLMAAGVRHELKKRGTAHSCGAASFPAACEASTVAGFPRWAQTPSR